MRALTCPSKAPCSLLLALVLLPTDASDECHGFDEMWGLCPGLPKCEECRPVDCEFSDWGEWYGGFGDCTGLRFHERTVAVTNNECGKPCVGAKVESEERVPEECRPRTADCVLADWSPWSECQESTAQAHRSRKILAPATDGGEPCTGSTEETMPCGEGPKPVPCELSDWQEWTDCSSSCGEGRHTRMRRVLAGPRHGGSACEGATLETRPCSLAECGGSDCAVGEWSEWSMCIPERHPQRYRRRQILRAAVGTGKRCNQTLVETRGCPEPEGRACRLSAWSAWRAPEAEGPEPPSCSRECGGGQAVRTRFMETPPSHGGACPDGSLRELKACNARPCVASCGLSDWTQWSPCSADCGRGTKTRARSLVAPGGRFGEGCRGPLEEALPCLGEDGECPHTDCQWSEWYDWSVCSATCGGGTTQRNRVIKSVPSVGGAACEARTKSEAAACNTLPCSEACVDGQWGDWQDWEPCTATCSSGFSLRRRALAREPSSCGRPAGGARREYKACSHLPPCVVDRDCEVSDWSEWGFCSSTCYGVHQRTRSIKVFASGRGRPCAGTGLREAAPCTPAPGSAAAERCRPAAPSDCVLGEWSDWRACSKPCGGGQRERGRKVLAPPARGGRPCDGELAVTAPCNPQPCEPEACSDCVWGMWSDWGDCSKCNGERYRHRSIQQMPNHCGKLCDLQSAKEVSNCTGHCEEPLFCAWTEWSTASGCAGGCGGRSALRSRALSLGKGLGEQLFAASAGSRCQGAQLDVSLCPDTQPCTPPCSPRDCVFSAWAEWDGPAASGLCERRRGIAVTNNECGRPCAGPLAETKRCKVASAERKNCLLSDWTVWSDCELNGQVGQRQRQRSVAVHPSFDGIPCGAALREAEQCGGPPEPVHCELSQWGMWDECAKSCGGGWQNRARILLRHAEHGGRPCEGGLAEMRPCNEAPCNVIALDCLYSDWQAWSGCGAHGQRYRRRKVARPASGGGLACAGDLEETASCAEELKVDCMVSLWTAWGACDKTCGGGQTHRQREIMIFPAHGGAPCPNELMQTSGCSQNPCSFQDCLVSDWQAWSACSASCGEGQRQRRRGIVRARSPGGAGCSLELSQLRPCEGPACPAQDCAWEEWSDWADCSASCGGGQQARQRGLARVPDKGGALCEAADKQEVRPCNTQACSLRCQDGFWGPWSKWSECSASCGGGLRYRNRQVAGMANECGSPATGKGRETTFCKVASCEPTYDCLFTDWGGWSDCSTTCNGIMKRSRRILQYGSGEGTFCVGALKETWPCSPRPGEPTPEACSVEPVADCELGMWTDWGACSASCGGGEHVRSREVLVAPANGGRLCEVPLTIVRQCAAAACPGPGPVDCELGPWQDWGACDKCGGERTRFRHVVQYPRHGGRPCEPAAAEDAGACPRSCGGERRFCSWGAWAAWGGCSARCGAGRRMRRRYLGLSAEAAAPPRALLQRWGELRSLAEGLEEGSGQELLLAFAGGAVSFVLGLAGLRTLSAAGAGLRPADATSRQADEQPLVRSA